MEDGLTRFRDCCAYDVDNPTTGKGGTNSYVPVKCSLSGWADGIVTDKARVAVNRGSDVREPKSESSSRLISLSTNIVYVPRYHLKNQQQMFEALGIPWTEDCYLFCNDRCEPYNSYSVTMCSDASRRERVFRTFGCTMLVT